ncbi:molybdenum cofactor guanylyltransferase [Candidatus Poribacteria bacterium]|nr:molybdenum cofactor guanylyltransferase [Candidatus Poribacteria bacterium]
MKSINNAVTGVILAGGSSRRMGQNKATMRLGAETIIEHVIRRMRAITAEGLVITNTPALYAHLGLPMYTDIVPDMGTLGGIYTGLTYAANPSVLCVGCDMPLLQPNLLSYLASILEDYDAVVPYVEEGGSSAPTFQTLSAVYSKRCVPVINQMLVEGELRVHAMYDRIAVRRVEPQEWQKFDPQGLSFFNINTPADFEKAVQMLR